MRRYNLFRLQGGDLCCAVPESHAVPRFVSGERWTFDGRVLGEEGREEGPRHGENPRHGAQPRHEAAPPPGFDRRAAVTAVRFNGFYLFQVLDGRHG